MNPILSDLLASFFCALFVLPIVMTIEWKAPSPGEWIMVLLPVTLVCGLCSYLMLSVFTDGKGIVSGPGPRDLAIRWSILLGMVLGVFFLNFLLKPLAYKLIARLNKRKKDK